MKTILCLVVLCLASALAWEYKSSNAYGSPAAHWGHGAYGNGAWELARTGWSWNKAAHSGYAGWGWNKAAHPGYAGWGHAAWPAARGAWGWAGPGHVGAWSSRGYGYPGYARSGYGYGAWNAWKHH